MRSLKYLAAGLTLLAAPALAQVPVTALAECGTIESGVDRLACFDTLTAEAVEGVIARDETDAVTWMRITGTDPGTGAELVTISNTREARLDCGDRSSPMLAVQCGNGRTTVAFIHNCNMPTNFRNIFRRLQIDWGTGPEDHIARVIPGNHGIAWLEDLPPADPAGDILARLLTHDEVSIRLEPTRRGDTEIVRFPLTGLAPLMAQGGDSCGWADLVADGQDE